MESGASPVGGALGRNIGNALGAPGISSGRATRGSSGANRGDAGIALRIELRACGTHAVCALLSVDVARRSVAIRGHAVATNFRPARGAARRLDRANRRGAGAATVLQRSGHGTNIVGTTCSRATCGVGNESATIVPRVATTVRPRTTTERTNCGGASGSAPGRHGDTGLTNAVRTAAIVNGSVAIIVDVVATNLAHRERRLRALQRAVVAVERAIGTRTNLAGYRASATAARITFIDDVVAVIVETIADFVRRKHRLRTERRTILALNRADGANTELASNGAHHAACSFVGGSIAIVVDAIACLVLGHRRRIAFEHAHGARRRSCRTSPLKPRHARLAGTRIAIVDHTVAIVVLAVADLGNRHRIRFALERTGRAIECSLGTCTGQTGVTHDAAAGVTFVGRAIAVVIDAVADFGHRHTWHTGLRNATRTSLHGHLTAAHTARQGA